MFNGSKPKQPQIQTTHMRGKKRTLFPRITKKTEFPTIVIIFRQFIGKSDLWLRLVFEFFLHI